MSQSKGLSYMMSVLCCVLLFSSLLLSVSSLETNITAGLESAMSFARDHTALLRSRTPIRYTEYDDEIYKDFRLVAPTLSVTSNVDASHEGKEGLKEFVTRWENRIGNAASVTALRIVPSYGYVESNVQLVSRMIFYAYEIARQREAQQTILSSDSEYNHTSYNDHHIHHNKL